MNKKISAYIEMTKPRIMTLVLVTTALGYYLGGQGINSWLQFVYLLIASGLVCGGSSVLNHYLERDYDAKMNRTKNRPIPSGIISPNNALQFGIILTLIGVFILYTKINILTSFLGLLTTFLYVLVYTPMKRVSWFNTTVGAVPGAIPPLGGWAAATGTLDFNAGMLFLIMFIWQHPHFYAIAWMLKEDYKRGGFQMLPLVENGKQKTFTQILWYSIILIPVSVVPTLTGLSGYIYCVGSIVLGLLLFYTSWSFIKSGSIEDARNLLKATVYYLPVLLFFIIIDVQF